MNFRYLVLFIFILKSASSYKPSRQPRLANTKTTNDESDNANKTKYKSKYDQAVQSSTRLDFFPEVEYPSSILDASKPFYSNMNPFSQDVQTSFNNYDSQKASRQKPTIILNLIAKNSKKDKTPTLKLVEGKKKMVELNLKSKAKENITDVPLILDDKIIMDNTNLHGDKLTKSKTKPNVSKEQLTDLNKFVTLTDSEVGVVNNSVNKLFTEDSNTIEIVSTASSDLTLPNNDTDDIFDKHLIAKNNKKDKTPTLKSVEGKSKIVELNLKNKAKENITEIPIILDDKLIMDNTSLHGEKLTKSEIKHNDSKEQLTDFNEFVSLTDSKVGIVNNSVNKLFTEDSNPTEIVITASSDLTLPNNDTDDIFNKYLIAKNNKKDKTATLKLVQGKSKTVELNLKNKAKENITEIPIILDDKIIMDNTSLHGEKLTKSEIKHNDSKEQLTDFNEFVSLTDSKVGIVDNSVNELYTEESNTIEIVTTASSDLTLPNNDTDDIFDKYLSIELEPLLYSRNLSILASEYDDCILDDTRSFNSEQYSYESLEE